MRSPFYSVPIPGTGKLFRGSSRCDYRAYEIIFVSTANLDLYKLSWQRREPFWRIAYQNAAVDVRSLCFQPSLPKQFGFFRFALEHYAHRLPNASLVLPQRDAGLLFHQTCASLLGNLWLDFIRQIVRRRSFFI